MKEIFFIDPNNSEVQRMREKRELAAADNQRTSGDGRQTIELSSQQPNEVNDSR